MIVSNLFDRFPMYLTALILFDCFESIWSLRNYLIDSHGIYFIDSRLFNLFVSMRLIQIYVIDSNLCSCFEPVWLFRIYLIDFNLLYSFACLIDRSIWLIRMYFVASNLFHYFTFLLLHICLIVSSDDQQNVITRDFKSSDSSVS